MEKHPNNKLAYENRLQITKMIITKRLKENPHLKVVPGTENYLIPLYYNEEKILEEKLIFNLF